MATDRRREKVCIVIPVCNEEASIPQLRERLESLHRQMAIFSEVRYVLVDDGSTDKTSALLPSAIPTNARYKVVTHNKNRGVGAAFRSGFQQVGDADFVCTIDADCSYRPEHLLHMVEEVRAGKTDIIVASPYHPLGKVDGVEPWRLTLSRQCSRLYQLASPLELYTYTSIFRVYRAAAVRQLQFQSDDFIAAVEILLSASSRGFRISEMPLTLWRRSAGASKMRILATVGGHLKLLAECLFAGRNFPARLCASGDTTSSLCRTVDGAHRRLKNVGLDVKVPARRCSSRDEKEQYVYRPEGNRV